jgi:hypothetical protein
MELLGDAGHVEPQFGLFGDNVSVRKRKEHDLRRTNYKLKNCFRHTRWNCSVTWAMWYLISVYLLVVLIWTQYWSTVCAQRTIGSEIILDAPDGTPR